jgi:hypothetical protein
MGIASRDGWGYIESVTFFEDICFRRRRDSRLLHLRAQRLSIKKGKMKTVTYLVIHQRIPKYEIPYVKSFGEVVIVRSAALRLALSGSTDEFSEQVKFAPMDFCGVVDVNIGVSFMSTNEI